MAIRIRKPPNIIVKIKREREKKNSVRLLKTCCTSRGGGKSRKQKNKKNQQPSNKTPLEIIENVRIFVHLRRDRWPWLCKNKTLDQKNCGERETTKSIYTYRNWSRNPPIVIVSKNSSRRIKCICISMDKVTDESKISH